MVGTRNGHPGHWAVLESPDPQVGWGCRLDSVGVDLPAGRLTTSELMSRTRFRTRIQSWSG